MKDYRAYWGVIWAPICVISNTVTAAHFVVQLSWVADRTESWLVGGPDKGGAGTCLRFLISATVKRNQGGLFL